MEKMTLVTLKQLFPNDNIHDAIEFAWHYGLLTLENYVELWADAQRLRDAQVTYESSLLLGH